MMCETFKDRHNNWTKPIATTTRNPVANSTHPYNQKCNIWSIDFRKNQTDCPALIRPFCHVLNHEKYNFKCPFGYKDGHRGVTQEYCECLGLTKEKMNVSHPFNCTCTRNLLSKEPVVNSGTKCYEYYLFTKTCVINHSYEVNVRNQTNHTYRVTRYNANCSFTNCFDDPKIELYKITGFNTTCSNGYSLAQPPTTTKPTTTIKTTATTTKPTTTIKTTTAVTTAIMSEPTSIVRSTTTPQITTTIRTITIASNTTTPQATTTFALTASNIPKTTNPSSTVSKRTTISNKSYLTYTSAYAVNTNVSADNNLLELELYPSNVEFSKQMNEGSLFGIMLVMAIFQFVFILGFGIFKQKRQSRQIY